MTALFDWGRNLLAVIGLIAIFCVVTLWVWSNIVWPADDE